MNLEFRKSYNLDIDPVVLAEKLAADGFYKIITAVKNRVEESRKGSNPDNIQFMTEVELSSDLGKVLGVEFKRGHMFHKAKLTADLAISFYQKDLSQDKLQLWIRQCNLTLNVGSTNFTLNGRPEDFDLMFDTEVTGIIEKRLNEWDIAAYLQVACGVNEVTVNVELL